MQQVYGYLIMVVSAIIISEIVLMIMPSGNMSKFVRIVMGIVLLCVIVGSISKVSVDLNALRVPQSNTPAQSEKNYRSYLPDIYREIE